MKKAVVAGTFNVLHEGHKALIRRAFEIGDEVYIGITSDEMASASRDKIVSLHVRQRELESYIEGMGPYHIEVINDFIGGLSKMGDLDVLVVSEETLSNGEMINEIRKVNGLKPLELSVVPLVMADSNEKISSSSILNGEYGRKGNRDVIDIAIGSTNQVKVSAVRSVMEKIYGDVKITVVDVPSGVPEQPFGDDTHIGSENRARAALGNHSMSVGIEAGVFEMLDGLYDIQHCTIISSDGKVTYGMGSGFRYPDEVAELVRGGMTVGNAVKQVYGDTDIGKKKGAIGLLSKGLIDRKTLTEQSVIAAMIPRLWGE